MLKYQNFNISLIIVNKTGCLPILPKIIPFSVEATLTLALILAKS